MSSKYRGLANAKQTKSEKAMELKGSFRKAREQLSSRKHGQNPGRVEADIERVLFQREESIAQRFIGPLAIVNLVGALTFVGTIVQGGQGKLKEPNFSDAELPASERKNAPGGMQRALAIGMAAATAIAVAFTANRFVRSRLIELRAIGTKELRLYTRSLTGFPIVAREVAAGEITVSFARLRAAQKAALGDAASRKRARATDTPFVSFRLRRKDASGKDIVYTIDSLDASVLDVHAIEQLTTDLGKGR